MEGPGGRGEEEGWREGPVPGDTGRGRETGVKGKVPRPHHTGEEFEHVCLWQRSFQLQGGEGIGGSRVEEEGGS